MSRKFRLSDKELFRTVYVRHAWMPAAHLAAFMRSLSAAGALDDRWADFHGSTAHRWITDGQWRDQVQAIERLVDDDAPLPSDDEIDDRIMRRNLQMLDLLNGMILGGVGDIDHNLRRYTALQREVRVHAQIRRSTPLTPAQLLEIFMQAGQYAAGKAFDVRKAREFIGAKLMEARQLLPARAA